MTGPGVSSRECGERDRIALLRSKVFEPPYVCFETPASIGPVSRFFGDLRRKLFPKHSWNPYQKTVYRGMILTALYNDMLKCSKCHAVIAYWNVESMPKNCSDMGEFMDAAEVMES